MENFVLYEEIGKFGEITMHKGRRKGTIIYLAICCIDKACRAKITNHVRFVHEFHHEKIVKFFEWYETCNHLWLVMELCTGGTLQQVIDEDKHLPESVIRKFGADLVSGLHYMHSMGVLYSDWRPVNILLDGQGTMKYFDFTLTRKVDENLMDLFEQFGDDSNSSSYGKRRLPNEKLEPAFNYLAPEILQGKNYNMSSDLWGFGCVLYEMYCGQQAFTAQNERQLVDKILHRDPPPLKAKGTRVSGKPSPEFLNLVSSLLKKNPQERLSWKSLINHPFWQGELEQILREDAGGGGSQSIAGIVSQCVSTSANRNITERRNTPDVRDRQGTPGTSARGQTPLKEQVMNKDETDHSEASWPLNHPPRPATAAGLRGVTTEDHGASNSLHPNDSHVGEDEVSFTMHVSSRPVSNGLLLEQATTGDVGGDGSSQNRIPDENVASEEQFLRDQSDSNMIRDDPHRIQGESILRLLRGFTEESSATRATSGRGKSFLHSHQPLPLVDYTKLLRTQSATSFDPKSLPVPPYSLQKLKAMDQKEVQKHLTQVFTSFSQVERGPPSQKRMQLLNYLLSLTTNPECALSLFTIGFIRESCKQLKDQSQQHTPPFVDSRIRLTRLIASTVYHCPDNSLAANQRQNELSECLTLLSELFRDQFRVTKTKEALLLSLGEVVCRLARHCSSLSSIPSMTITQVTRCLHRNEDVSVSVMACRIIENICFTATESGLDLSTAITPSTASSTNWINNELASQLWTTFKYSNQDTLRFAASSALCAVSLLQASCFIHVADKIGLTSLLEQTQVSHPKVQENILAMLAVVLLRHSVSSSCKKLAQDRKFTQALMSLLDSPSYFIRGYVYFIFSMILPTYPETFQSACRQRLVSFLDRDLRWIHAPQNASPRDVTPTNDDGISRRVLTECLHHLQQLLMEFLPTAWHEILNSLEAVQGRMHPSTTQTRKLKQWVPILACILDLGNCVTLRQKMLHREFLEFLSDLLRQCVPLLRSETNLEPALGARANQEVCGLALCLLEIITQQKEVLEKYSDTLVYRLLPELAKLIGSSPHSGGVITSVGPHGPTGDGQLRVSETQVIALKLFSDIIESTSLLKEAASSRPSSASSAHPHKTVNEINRLFDETIIPQSDAFLQSMEPASGHMVHLLNLYLSRNPSAAISSLYRHQFHHTFLHHLLHEVTRASNGNALPGISLISYNFQECLRLLCSLLTISKDRLSNTPTLDKGSQIAVTKMVPEMVHELEVVPILLVATFHISDICQQQESSTLSEINNLPGCLRQSLETVNALLKYVSDVVRQALQMRHSSAGTVSPSSARSTSGGGNGAPVDTVSLHAEQLLLACRPLTELLPLLCQLLCHEDGEVSEEALRAVSHLASLYGADQSGTGNESGVGNTQQAGSSHALSDANLYWLSVALGKADTKRARLLLRILKRFFVTFTARGNALPSNLQHLPTLENALATLNRSAQAQVDNTLKQLSQELLQIIRKP